MMMPPRTTIEIDEANGLNRMITPQIKSIIPSSSQRYQFGTPFRTEIEILMTLMLDRIIQIPSAIVKIVARTFGMASIMIPTMIDKIPDIMPWNGIYTLCAAKSSPINVIPWIIM